MNIFILPNTDKPEAFKAARSCARLLSLNGVHILVNAAHKDRIFASDDVIDAIFTTEEDAWRQCDIVLTVGGDGTMLHAAVKSMQYHKPLFGVNTGRLGFLTTLETDELEQLARLPNGDFIIEERSVIEVASGNSVCKALNDIVFFKGSVEKTILLDIFCDDVFVSRLRGDGVVFATPTGSTAYSLSAGGPVVDARIPCITVTQICAHIVQTPPLVFADDRLLRVAQGDNAFEQVFVSCDGMRPFLLPKEQEAVVRLSDCTVPLVCFSDADQLKSIDSKLKGR